MEIKALSTIPKTMPETFWLYIDDSIIMSLEKANEYRGRMLFFTREMEKRGYTWCSYWESDVPFTDKLKFTKEKKCQETKEPLNKFLLQNGNSQIK